MYEGMTERERRPMCMNLLGFHLLRRGSLSSMMVSNEGFLDLQLLNLYFPVFSSIINPNTDSNASSLLLIPDSYEPFHVVVSHTPTLSSLGATSATVTTELALFIGNMT
ncbi:hypothetical protein V2J09_003963 [Rumex salicifolius]